MLKGAGYGPSPSLYNSRLVVSGLDVYRTMLSDGIDEVDGHLLSFTYYPVVSDEDEIHTNLLITPAGYSRKG